MKNPTRTMRILAALLLLATALPLFAQAPAGAGVRGTCCVTAVTPLTADEAKWLAYMREEEKLARDVYTLMYEKWKLRIFSNIAQSEQQHGTAVATLLARYGQQDPAAQAQPGIYSNPELTTLYNWLVAKGNVSLKDALEVGALIEMHDIDDLEAALAGTAKADVKTVYSNLHAGSLNHLDAFEAMLQALAPAN